LSDFSSAARGLEGTPVERDDLVREALETVTQPVFYRLADRVATVRYRDPGSKVSAEFLEPVLDLLLGLTAHLAADPLAVRCVAERHRATPASRAPLWYRASRQGPEWSK
jgi:hypothetical protein